MMRASHIGHSGVLIENQSKQLFFDVVTDVHHLINPLKEVFFFVTHGHGDHYQRWIFEYKGERVHFILSSDIEDSQKIANQLVVPNEVYSVGGLKIKTYGSTDCGVSFLVYCDEKVIFHAGDLNWWHWENDSHEVQEKEARDYKAIVDQIEDVFIDIACVPVDPRLNSACFYGADYFMDVKVVGFLMPIHFNAHVEICEAFKVHRKGDVPIGLEWSL